MIYQPQHENPVPYATNGFTHPVLWTVPKWLPAGYMDLEERDLVIFRVQAATGPGGIYLPPSQYLGLRFAKSLRVVASGSFRGASFSVDEVYPLRIPRDDPAAYALGEDTARDRLAMQFASFDAYSPTWTPQWGGEINHIEESGTPGEAGEVAFGFNVPSSLIPAFFEGDSIRPPYWGSFGSLDWMTVSAFVREANPDYDPEDESSPETLEFYDGIESEDYEVSSDPEAPQVVNGDMVFLGVQIPHTPPAEGSFSIVVTIEEYVIF